MTHEEKAKVDDPYWYFPQCDVNNCNEVSSSGGNCWRETGYWSVCPIHSADYRNGLEQPKMKQSSVEREKKRDPKTGYLSQ